MGKVKFGWFFASQGTEAAEVQAARLAGEAGKGATAYLNLETGDCHGDDVAVSALLGCGVQRVVVGLKHPLPHLRGLAVSALRERGLAVDVLRDAWGVDQGGIMQEALQACLEVNQVGGVWGLGWGVGKVGGWK